MHRSYRLFASLLTAYNSRYEYCFLSNGITSFTTSKIAISTIRLHSASSLQIPRSTARFNSLLPTVNVLHLKLHSVSSINLYGSSNYNIFRNHRRIRLSPIKSPILLIYKNMYKSTYPDMSKFSAKSCICCNHLICPSTIISSVNHRQFSVVNNSVLD